MKRIALVHPRYGLEISGGSETYARKNCRTSGEPV